MKTLFMLTALLLIAVISKAQLKNTKWQGTMMIPGETNIILDFKADSVNMVIADNGMVGESMTYSIKDSVITMKKTGGNSPCSVGGEFTVKYLIKDDKLFINNLADPCDTRVGAWTKEPFTRLKE